MKKRERDYEEVESQRIKIKEWGCSKKRERRIRRTARE